MYRVASHIAPSSLRLITTDMNYANVGVILFLIRVHSTSETIYCINYSVFIKFGLGTAKAELCKTCGFKDRSDFLTALTQQLQHSIIHLK